VTSSRTGTVYVLVDPRDNKIRYVGKTEKPILARLASHMATPTNPAMRVWINALSLQGLVPRIQAVVTAPVAQLDAEEQHQILQHAKAGHRLLNAPYYHQHLVDLDQTAVVSSPPRPRDARVARAMYAGLAQARADGRVPALAVAAVVVATSPFYAIMTVARGLLRAAFTTAAGIRILVLSGSAWVLWDAGFSRAVRDLVLPHLPIRAAVAFWSTYVQPPLSNLVPAAWQTGLIFTAVAAISAYCNVAKRYVTRTN